MQIWAINLITTSVDIIMILVEIPASTDSFILRDYSSFYLGSAKT